MADDSGSVTVIAKHRLRPGTEGLFKAWQRGITADSQRFAGYLGGEVIRPMASDSDEYITIFRFDRYDNLEAWMESPQRRQWLERTQEFSDEAPLVHYHNAEFWLPSTPTDGKAPSNARMALITFLALWPMVHWIPSTMAQHLAWPVWAIEAGSLAVIVLLMTYVVMPPVMRVLRVWLHP